MQSSTGVVQSNTGVVLCSTEPSANMAAEGGRSDRCLCFKGL